MIETQGTDQEQFSPYMSAEALIKDLHIHEKQKIKENFSHLRKNALPSEEASKFFDIELLENIRQQRRDTTHHESIS